MLGCLHSALQVSFILSGEQDETDVRTFGDTKRDILQRGGVDVFALTTPRCVCVCVCVCVLVC